MDCYVEWRNKMGFGQSKDLNCYEKGRKNMGFGQSKHLDCYEKGREKMGFARSKDLDCYEKKRKKDRVWMKLRFGLLWRKKKTSLYTRLNSRVWLGRSSYAWKSWKKWSDFGWTDQHSELLSRVHATKNWGLAEAKIWIMKRE